jgi:hypothetical protein
MKIENDHDNVEYKLTHLVKLVDEVCENYGYVDESEHASMLLALDRDMIQVAHNMDVVRQYLYKFLFDPFKIDYNEWKVTIDKKITCLESLLNATHLEDERAILKTPDDIVKDEDQRYKDITYIRAYDTEVSSRVRISLIRSRVNMYKDIINGLRAISDTLNGINKDKETLLNNNQIRKNHFKALYESFLVSEEWRRAKETFIRKVKHYVRPYENKSEGYQSFLEEYEDLNGDDIRTDLYETYLAGYDVSAFIIKYRDEIGIADIHCLFGYILTHKMLQIKVQSFEVLKAPDNNHNKLFINQGAQELIETLVPLFAKHVYFGKSYQYTALYLAIQDMGLMPKGGSNAPQFVKFVNKHFKENIRSNDTITKCTGPLFGHSYGKVERENYHGTNLDDERFDAIRNEYHICLSIINKVMNIDLAEAGFAKDVWKEHRDTPSFTDYNNLERLFLLRDILQGKHTEI